MKAGSGVALLVAFLVSYGSACSDSGACTETGCGAGVDVGFEPVPSDPGNYRLEVETDSGVLTCSFEMLGLGPDDCDDPLGLAYGAHPDATDTTDPAGPRPPFGFFLATESKTIRATLTAFGAFRWIPQAPQLRPAYPPPVLQSPFAHPLWL